MIRKLQMSDKATAEAIWRLQHAAYREEMRRIGIAYTPPLLDTVEKLRCAKEHYLGYEKDGEWAGALAYTIKGDKLSIDRLMVHPDFFRQGIASALLDEVISQTKHKFAEVYVSEKNEPAVQLYRKWSFEPRKRIIVSPEIVLIQCIRCNPNHDKFK